MPDFTPHVTVASVVETDGKFLLVEEMSDGERVFNQPAGHLEANETLQQAAIRETLEETGWHIELTGFLGVSIFTSPFNQACYIRNTFAARAIHQQLDAKLDPEIIAPHWLALDEIVACRNLHRSELVLDSIHRYQNLTHASLDLVC